MGWANVALRPGVIGGDHEPVMRGDEGEGEGRDEAAGAGAPAGSSPPAGGSPSHDASIHPARHLRARQLGPTRAGPVAGLPEPWRPLEGGGGVDLDLGGGSATPSRATGGPDPSAPARPGGGWHPHPPRWRRGALVGTFGLALAVAAGSTAVALLTQTHPPSTPTPAPIPPVPPAQAIGDLHMLSASTGWARRVMDGAVLHTTGGMAGWTVAAPLPGQLVAVAYVGLDTASALAVPSGASGNVTAQAWTTQDGGASWSPGGTLSFEGFNPAIGGTLDFADSEHGWFSEVEAADGLSGTALFRTENGGVSWSQVAATGSGGAGSPGMIPEGCDDLTATFVSATTGFITGTCLAAPPPLYVSQDAGATWAAAPLAPLPAGITAGTSFPPTFTSGQGGALLTQNQTESGGLSTSIFATTDGGLSWQQRAAPSGSPVASDFLDSDHGWVVTNEDSLAGASELYATQDGGSAWTRLNAFPYVGIGLDFLTPEAGWAAPALGAPEGGPSYLIRTTDGGRSWSAAVPRIAGPSPSG